MLRSFENGGSQQGLEKDRLERRTIGVDCREQSWNSFTEHVLTYSVPSLVVGPRDTVVIIHSPFLCYHQSVM